MSLISSMYTGASGLEANTTDLSVIGDNIANANTVGFKASRAAFEEAMVQQLVGSGLASSQVGIGTRLQSIQKIITQGALSNTGLATDLSVDGKGFFVVSGQRDGRNGQFYTRAGQFTVDNSGYLVNLDGLRVQGYSATNGVLGISVGDLQVGTMSAPPALTQNVSIMANLSADATVPTGAFDPTNAVATSNFSTSITIYDTLGASHQVDVYFAKTAAGAWGWHALTDGSGVSGGVAGTPTEIASGTLTFDTEGRLSAATTATNNFSPVGATNPQPLTFNFGDPTGAGGTGLTGITQFASPSGTSSITQDGYAAGSLTHVAIDREGTINGTFTNGRTLVVGQIAVATVPAPDMMDRVGGNLFAVSESSGQPALGTAGTGGRGAIVAGTLEQSNVDLASEFVRMIAAQRGFQANSKSIQTADALLSELMMLKR